MGTTIISRPTRDATHYVFEFTAGGTQFTPFLNVGRDEVISYQVEHPASTTTTYTHEVSNSPPGQKPVLVTDPDIVVPTKSAAEDFGIDPSPVNFASSRLKLVTSAGTGAIKITAYIRARPVEE